MSFTNVLKYGLVSQGGVECIPDAAYVPQLPTLAAGDYRRSNAGNWTSVSLWERYDGSTWATATAYVGQNAGDGYATIGHDVTINTSPVNIFKGLIINGGNLTPNRSYTVRISENLYMLSNNIFYFSVSNNRALDFYVGGDLVLTAGTMTETTNRYGVIYINGGKVQQYYNTGTVITNEIRWVIQDNSIFKMDNYIIPNTCLGTFTLGAGCGLIIGSPSGITSSGAAGNIQSTGVRTFSTGADYTYNMSNGTQYTGNGLPTTVRNLSFTGCKKTMVLSNNITVTGTYFKNPSVKVNLNGYTLTLP